MASLASRSTSTAGWIVQSAFSDNNNLKANIMCGIFGYVAKDESSEMNLQLIQSIAIETESRGPHSYGFAWIDSRNRLKMFKSVGRISRQIDMLEMALDAKMLIGHCRFATHGDIDRLNAHPHPSDGGWIVHNGMIRDYELIQSQHGLNPVTDCDSETIGLMIETLDGPLVDRVVETIGQVATSNFAMMGLWKSPNRMIIARSGNPLHTANWKSGTYLASNPTELGKHATAIQNQTMKLYSFKSGEIDVQSHNTSPKRRSFLF